MILVLPGANVSPTQRQKFQTAASAPPSLPACTPRWPFLHLEISAAEWGIHLRQAAPVSEPQELTGGFIRIYF